MHQAANGIAVPVVLLTDGLTRSGMTTTYHLWISGGALSVVVIAERRYGPCRLSDDNNNNNLESENVICYTEAAVYEHRRSGCLIISAYFSLKNQQVLKT